MKIFSRWWLLQLFFLPLFLFQSGCVEPETQDTVSGNLDLSSPGGLEFATVTEAASDATIDEISISKTEISGSEKYVVIPYLTGSQDGVYADTKLFDVSFAATVNGSDYGETVAEESAEETTDETQNDGESEAAAALLLKSFPDKPMSAPKSELVFGDSLEFYFSRDGVTLERNLTAKVRSVGTDSIILVDEEDLELAEEEEDATLDEAILDIAENIESLIIPRMNTLFGAPYAESDAILQTSASIDGLVSVVLTSRLNDTDTLAIFHPQDMLAYDSLLNPTSNQQYIIYLAYPTEETPLAQILAAFVASYQHLINYSMKVLGLYREGLSTKPLAEASFLDNGLSALAQDLVGLGNYNFIQVTECLTSLSQVAFAAPISSPCQTAMVYLFLRAYFEKEGGATYSTSAEGTITGGGIDLLRALITSQTRGITNLTDALQEDFATLMGHFLAQLILDPLSLNDEYQFETPTLDSFTEQTKGISLSSDERIIDDTTYATSALPADDFPQTTAISLAESEARFYNFVPSAGTFEFSVSASEDAGIHFLIIRTE